MKHLASSRFWQCFDALPAAVQTLARRNFAQLRNNPAHPSLQLKRLADTEYYSVRVGLYYRALGKKVPGGIQWFWIGSHADYDKLVG